METNSPHKQTLTARETKVEQIIFMLVEDQCLSFVFQLIKRLGSQVYQININFLRPITWELGLDIYKHVDIFMYDSMCVNLNKAVSTCFHGIGRRKFMFNYNIRKFMFNLNKAVSTCSLKQILFLFFLKNIIPLFFSKK